MYECRLWERQYERSNNRPGSNKKKRKGRGFWGVGHTTTHRTYDEAWERMISLLKSGQMADVIHA